jgi:hypothetical protein
LAATLRGMRVGRAGSMMAIDYLRVKIVDNYLNRLQKSLQRCMP